MTPLFGFLTTEDLLPVFVFVGIMAGTFWLLGLISRRNSLAEDRLERIGRPKSLVEIEMDTQASRQRFGNVKDAFAKVGEAMQQNELEKSGLRVRLMNAGFRSENAVAIYQGLRLICLVVFLLPAAGGFLWASGFTLGAAWKIMLFGCVGFYLPQVALAFMRSGRQKEIFLTLPDALDLLVVCTESGLGLDAGLRKVTDEMKSHAKVLCEELTLANLQMQMGRPRREVLHDLGVRTGVDDLRSLAAILIQADRFGSSIAQALRVQSDAMRTRRRQLAEEKAAQVAVKLIFPLVLFIFPAIFVVLVGPAAIQIQKQLLSKTPGG
ncbi:MAG TPA: type II secretion system F family protein [Fimbriiglobus sp.]